MPSLVRRRPLLRAAAISGGAYRMGKRREAAKQRELEDQQRLEGLGKLREEGALTDEEFAKQKAQLLDG